MRKVAEVGGPALVTRFPIFSSHRSDPSRPCDAFGADSMVQCVKSREWHGIAERDAWPASRSALDGCIVEESFGSRCNDLSQDFITLAH